jgi:hypothetical protein
VVLDRLLPDTNRQEAVPHEHKLPTELRDIVVGQSKEFFFGINGLKK